MTMTEVESIGIDPAVGASKPTMVHDPQGSGEPFVAVAWNEVADWLRRRGQRAANGGKQLLVAWDAPLTADPTRTVPGTSALWTRPVERWWATQVVGRKKGGVDPDDIKGISIRAYAGLPHWTVTSHTFRGAPWHTRSATGPAGTLGFRDVSDQFPATWVVEVHPALTAYVLGQRVGPYKQGGRAERDRLLKAFGQRPGLSDDHLDAYLAWRCVDAAAHGNAAFLGQPDHGGFLLPDTERGGELMADYQRWSSTELDAPSATTVTSHLNVVTCPIDGCGFEFTRGYSGWDSHVASWKRHPWWLPGITDGERRKHIFKDAYPEFRHDGE